LSHHAFDIYLGLEYRTTRTTLHFVATYGTKSYGSAELVEGSEVGTANSGC